MTDPLSIEALKVQCLRARLLELYPELGEDAQTLADTLEGMTDFNEMVCVLIDSAENDQALANALKERVADMNERMARFSNRVERKRNAVASAMEAAQVKKIEAPEFTISLRNNPPKVVIIDETQIPADYWREKVSRSVDKTAVKEALANGIVPGAELSNGGVGLTVRTK